MLTPYTAKGDAMHVLPLPFGLGLALYRRPRGCEFDRRRYVWSTEPLPAREGIRTDSRCAAFRQRLV
jgi:hypothetical protein